ncbi:MAG: cytochrome d ubiquinol oxidase subunit II [Verrucomicrobiota bacterium]|nr:cytochrome d ubiquinol oxidase subunit II [Verrucomicrobiota bacterium]
MNNAEHIIAAFLLLALIFYAVTAGADFGGGMWTLLATGPRATAQRKQISKALGPIWEADHVWLILVVVILFTAFPSAFAAIMTALHIPVTLMLIGIILRGSAFIFGKYDTRVHKVQRGWSTMFGAASFFTPFVQGVTLGALATGQIRVVDGVVSTGFFVGWLTPFALVCGLFALLLCGFLAAVYLTLDPELDPEVQNDFRLRALWSGVALVPVAIGVFLTARSGAPEIFGGLTSGWGLLLMGATTCCAAVALLSLWSRQFQIARLTAISEVTLILAGWSLAQYPNLVVPDVTLLNSAAPVATLRLLTIALCLGAIVLLPSLAFLFYLFKARSAR